MEYPKLTLPKNPQDILQLTWKEMEPIYNQLLENHLTADNVEAWLKNWSITCELVSEQYNRLMVATTLDVENLIARDRYQEFLETVFINSRFYDGKLKTKLVESGFVPKGMKIALRSMRAEAEIFNELNLSLFVEEQKLCNQHDEVVGAQTIVWENKEHTFMQMCKILLEEKDRSIRQESWIETQKRILKDKVTVHELWQKLFNIRQQIAINSGKSDYREYVWLQNSRFEYTPEDCKTFHTTIERVVLPVVKRIIGQRSKEMNIDSIRPWDEQLDHLGFPAMQPFIKVNQLIQGVRRIIAELDPVFEHYFQTMIDENLLDLDDRKNKAGSSYCAFYEYTRRPFIFMSAVGGHDDMQTLLHETGHAIHGFESAHLPYIMQRNSPMEFIEVASISMELFGISYLTKSGLYSERDAARAGILALEEMLKYWTYIALVDAFQHWAYENPHEGGDPECCDKKWIELHNRFVPYINYDGLEIYKPLRWHRQGHIFLFPFYFIEYGFAQLGAVQIWKKLLQDKTTAVNYYRKALSLGGTASPPTLYDVAGAKFAFDEQTVQGAVDFMEEQIEAMKKIAG